MANRTFSAQDRYKRVGTERRKKLKKVRSVKVANFDKLRLSMKKNRNQNELISGSSSPNYMKATSSSSARKSSVQSSLGNAPRNQISELSKHPALRSERTLKRVPSLRHSRRLSSKKSMRIRAKYSQFSDMGSDQGEILGIGIMGFENNADFSGKGIEIDEETTSSTARGISCQSTSGNAPKNEISELPEHPALKLEITLKRVPSLRHSRRLSSKKSMRIRAKYSQFSGIGSDQGDILGIGIMGFQNNAEIDAESLSFSSENDQKGILERSRSRKLTRIRSIRSLRLTRRTKSRFSGGEAEVVPFEGEGYEPHYMKATSSQQARKNSDKGLARTSSLRPLRILAKIPSLRPRRSKVKKRPQGTGVHRPTCSSTLKKVQFPDDIEHSMDREMDGISSLNVCPYSYCSIHGHRHHTPTQPLKEFISAKRKLFSNQKGEQPDNQSVGGLKNVESTEIGHSGEKLSTGSCDAVHEVMSFTTENDPEDEDDGVDFLINVYAKPRKKWATEGTMSEDAEALHIATYDRINGEQYEKKEAESLSESSGVEEKQGPLNDGQKLQQQTNNVSSINSPSELHAIGPKSVSINETLEPSTAQELQKCLENPFPLASRDSEVGSRDFLTNMLTDKQKYTSMWQLIYQEIVSNEASMSEALKDIQAEEQGSDGSKAVDDDTAARKKFELERTAAINLVQGALTAILQHDTDYYNQHSKSDQEMSDSFVTDEDLRVDCKDEIGNLDTAENQQNMKQIGNTSQKNKEPKEKGTKEKETLGGSMSKSLSKLRKMFVTAKFIKAMEGLKRINLHKPQYLSGEAVLENERVYLRHLSTKERKNMEEWMLDFALRQVISRLDPDEQRRVAQLVEAFERVAPGQKEKSNRPFSLASIPVNGEKKQVEEPNQDLSFSRDQLVERQDAEVLGYHSDIPKENQLTKEYEFHVNKTDDGINRESAETQIPGSTWVLSEKSSKSASVNKSSDNEGAVHEKLVNSLEVPSENPTHGSEVSPASGMTSIFTNKQKYTSMWNLIYQHVSSESSVDENQGIDGLDEEEQRGEANDQNKSSYSTDQKGDNYDKNVTSEKPDLDQSTAIKLVKEALTAILARNEQPTHTEPIRDHDRDLDNAKDLCIPNPASCTTGFSTDVENTSLTPKEVEGGDKFKEPQRKMSKSLSKLKKAIATTRFIKAMEKLMKSSPRKSQTMSPNIASDEGKVNLRHRSMNGRKKDEEWMLDYALRQVVSKLDPDQQRRVASLVEAFETMHPEKKDTRIRCAVKDKDTDCIEVATRKSEVQKNNLESQKQDDGILLPTKDAFPERTLEHDQQVNSEDGTIMKEINKSGISDSTLESSGNDPEILASAVIKLEEQNVGHEETSRATGNTEVKLEGEMASILFDKQKYTGMWHLIYQHVLINEASTTGKQDFNDDEEERNDDANTCHALKHSSSIQSSQLKKSEVDEDNQSVAIYLVKEAIHAILKSHEQRPEQESLQDFEKLCGTTALASTTENDEGKSVEENRETELEEKLHIIKNNNAPLEQQAEPKEATRRISKRLSKLKRGIATAKFIMAMERLRKISPRNPRYLPPEATSEEERVYLRHLSMKARKNDEEWMLDYALRKVISDLAPDQQRKVARLVEAFETVNPKQKRIKNATRAEWDLDVHCESKRDAECIIESKLDSSTACDDNIPSTHTDRLNMLRTHDTLENNVLEDQSINVSNLKMELPHEILDSENSISDIHQQASSKGTTVSENILTKREEMDDANHMHEPMQPAMDSQKNLSCDKQKTSSMWRLIYQHIESVSDAKSGSELNDGLTNEDQLNNHDASAKMIDDDSVDSSLTSQITEKDAVELVREAINDILDAPQGLSESTAGNKTVKDHKKSLSKGYSKLKKLINCNKFIKAMEKTQKFHPQKQPSFALNSDSEARKAQLKTSVMGEKKRMDEWMFDNVLQKAIAGLAPVKQRRVALLVEAFEKVNPNPEERGKGVCFTRTDFPDAISLEEDTNERENTEMLQNSRFRCIRDLKLEEGSPLSCGEVIEEPRIDNAIESSLQMEERATFRDAQHKEKNSFANKSIQPEDLEGEWNHNSQDSGSLRKSSNLWGLILQRVTTNMLEKGETPKQSIDVNAQEESEKMLERELDDSFQPSKVKSCRDMGVQTPESFDFEEDEAIKLVEEAVEEMLLVQDQLSDTDTSSTISEQEVYNRNNEDSEESSNLVTPYAEKSSTKESSLKTYNTLSKVMLCKKFVKAMDKRRKLKAASTQEVSQPSHSEKGIPSLRQITTNDKKGLEEGMLDHALQKVIGNLAPAKKQRVALLVQAFEAVGSQSEPTSRRKGKVSVS